MHSNKYLLAPLVLVALAIMFPSTAFAQQKYVAHISSDSSMGAAKRNFEGKRRSLLKIKRTVKPHIHRVDLGGKGIWYQLQIGPPASRRKMKRFCREWKSHGNRFCKVVSPFVLGNNSEGYRGRFLFEPQSDGRNMKIFKTVRFVDSNGRRWTVPAGTITDGASIPPALWWPIGGPFSGRYRKAAVIHDRYVQTKYRSWMDTHDVFYEAMIASKVPRLKALLMWAAVYRLGPRWVKSQSVCWGTCACSNVELENLTIRPKYSSRALERIKSIIRRSPSITRDRMRRVIDRDLERDNSIANITGVIRQSDGCEADSKIIRKFVESDEAPVNWHRWGRER